MRVSEFEKAVWRRMGKWLVLSTSLLIFALILRVAGKEIAAAIPAVFGLIALGFGHGWEAGQLQKQRGGRKSVSR